MLTIIMNTTAFTDSLRSNNIRRVYLQAFVAVIGGIKVRGSSFRISETKQKVVSSFIVRLLLLRLTKNSMSIWIKIYFLEIHVLIIVAT